jgi:hypothetical protein
MRNSKYYTHYWKTHILILTEFAAYHFYLSVVVMLCHRVYHDRLNVDIPQGAQIIDSITTPPVILPTTLGNLEVRYDSSGDGGSITQLGWPELESPALVLISHVNSTTSSTLGSQSTWMTALSHREFYHQTFGGISVIPPIQRAYKYAFSLQSLMP